ncbi:VWA domain-containing protein [Carboxylicivirga taeanensis]|uniref:VWA domain-containing protein n=1 Tax=Carboxylicivirga taeanensis TaxID=1416875 RepID=UPI003F6E0A53
MLFEFKYLWPFLLLPLPLLVRWLLPAFRKRRTALLHPRFRAKASLLNQQPRHSAWVSKRPLINEITLWLIWLLLVTAAAHPQLSGEPELQIKNARSIFIAADISFSMDTRDWVINEQPLSRWEAVKQIMADFIEQREGDRLGIIFFGSNAYLQSPLTSDLNFIRWQLDETDVGMAGQMTGIGNAIGYATSLFEADTLANKVLLVLTDGVDSGSDITPMDAANVAAKDSITIYTIGIGEATASNSDLDERTLKLIAAATNGQYFAASDPEQLKQAYTAFNELEPIEWEEQAYKPVVALYHYPLALALVLAVCQQLIMGLIKFASYIANRND